MTKYLFLLLALSLTLLASCGGDDDGNGGGGDGDAIRIGVLAPITGGLESYGIGARNAVELAASQINAAGGINGRTVQVIVENTEVDTTAASAGAARLVADGCVGIIGATSSSVTMHVARTHTAPNNIPQISGASTSPAISTLEDNNMLWRTCLSDIYAGDALSSHCFNELQLSTVAILNIDNPFGNGIANQFDQSFQSLGGAVASNESYPEQSDYSADFFANYIATLFEQRPPAVVIIGYGTDGQRILNEIGRWKDANDPDYDPVIFCSDSWDGPSITDNVNFDLLDNIIGSFNSPPENPESSFYQSYVAEHDIAPSPYVSNVYDAAMTLLLAIQAANATDGPSITAQLPLVASGGTPFEYTQLTELMAAISNGEDVDYQGASGPIQYDGNGDLVRGVVQLWRFSNSTGTIESETITSIEAGQ